jgi:CheY-like chemotaxis protein
MQSVLLVDDDLDTLEMYAVGLACAAVLTKPCLPDELAQMIRQVLPAVC